MFYLFGAGNDNNLGIFVTNWNGIIDFKYINRIIPAQGSSSSHPK